MNTTRAWSLIATLLFLLVAAAPAHAVERSLSGELVVTNAARNQFRIVGHDGEFIAPAGVPVDVLDGKAVDVQLGSDGRVREITQVEIPIDRVAHGVETVTGQMIVRDPVMRTFNLASDDRVYVAPASMDIRPYAGRMVELHMDEQGKLTDVVLLRSQIESATAGCAYESSAYADGSTRCERGQQFLCTRGEWRNLGTACVINASAQPRACMFGGATVAAGSSICRSGNTFRCADGEWINVGTPCS